MVSALHDISRVIMVFVVSNVLRRRQRLLSDIDGSKRGKLSRAVLWSLSVDSCYACFACLTVFHELST